MTNDQLIKAAIAADSEEPPVPFGACRQELAEFSPCMRSSHRKSTSSGKNFALMDLLPRQTQEISVTHV